MTPSAPTLEVSEVDTLEFCDKQIKDLRICMQKGDIDLTTGTEYIDLWLERRYSLMQKGGENEGTALA